MLFYFLIYLLGGKKMKISKTILTKIDGYVKKFDSVLDKPRKKFVHQTCLCGHADR